MTRLEQAEKALNKIKYLAESLGITGMIPDTIDKYFEDTYNFKNRNVTIQPIPDGSVARHHYMEGPSICATEFNIMSNKSAKEVLDTLQNIVDRIDFISGMQKIIIGIRTKSVNDVSFTHPNLYYGIYSVTGFDGKDYWFISAPGLMPERINLPYIVDKKTTSTDNSSKKLLRDLADAGIPMSPAIFSRDLDIALKQGS